MNHPNHVSIRRGLCIEKSNSIYAHILPLNSFSIRCLFRLVLSRLFSLVQVWRRRCLLSFNIVVSHTPRSLTSHYTALPFLFTKTIHVYSFIYFFCLSASTSDSVARTQTHHGTATICTNCVRATTTMMTNTKTLTDLHNTYEANTERNTAFHKMVVACVRACDAAHEADNRTQRSCRGCAGCVLRVQH